MRILKYLLPVLLIVLAMATATNAQAQSYLFNLDKLDLHVFVNSDGTVSMGYTFVFTNAPGAHPIDFVDIGTPSGRFNANEIEADVNGQPVQVSAREYQGSGSGFAIVMAEQAIQPGETATVHVWIPRFDPWLQQDTSDSEYASFVVVPTWFGRQYILGDTDMSVTIHLPPGVKPEEPRWHAAPSGFPSEPQTGIDDQGRVYYRWDNTEAAGWEVNEFGVSFPAGYVPAAAITRPSFWERVGIDPQEFTPFLMCAGGLGVVAFFSYLSRSAQKRRRMAYMPPKIAIEGMGIKRGLTAVEAAVLMEQPLDRVLTMILFGVLKKEAARVITREPLDVQPAQIPPEGLQPYEKEFLEAFAAGPKERNKLMQTMMINLVGEVSKKMKGFSRNETIDYYRTITERAWKQVEEAQTPTVKGEKYDEVLEWTMLDRDYDDRTKEVFTGPVIPPSWWWRFDPGFPHPGAGSRPFPVSTAGAGSVGGGSSGGGVSLPTLPGASFAASVVNGVQNFAGGVVGDLTEFTSGVTNKTNPIPVSTSTSNRSTWKSGGSGGRSCACACACACAGCACACAGGGR